MARVKRGTTSHARHKKVLEQTKGHRGRRNSCIKTARQSMEKALQYAYRDRRVKKREFRALWIQRINAAVREDGMTYGNFIHGLSKAGIEVDRKVLADLAVHDRTGFGLFIEKAQAALQA
ncbi:LSU ribosomal protein L20P [Arboricoccus pini]|uniref:Large ribosomal subunit protein bL20 n=1 Tax=Arboricoccus pini TaxID=1963835 RepID=A0A212RCS1_9PROT|nr:50S ribosomal protein L20 [Arboricoccus pini]SNB70075.1 LSU ribosomal protein L20P [Arboricoccus pini]